MNQRKVSFHDASAENGVVFALANAFTYAKHTHALCTMLWLDLKIQIWHNNFIVCRRFGWPCSLHSTHTHTWVPYVNERANEAFELKMPTCDFVRAHRHDIATVYTLFLPRNGHFIERHIYAFKDKHNIMKRYEFYQRKKCRIWCSLIINIIFSLSAPCGSGIRSMTTLTHSLNSWPFESGVMNMLVLPVNFDLLHRLRAR